MSEMARFHPRSPDSPPPPLPPEDLVVRWAEPADAASIARISAKREGLVISSIQPRIEAELGLPIFRERLGVWVATAAGAVRGYGRVRWDDQAEGTGPDAVPTGWYLMGVVIQPSWRRRGLASALLQARLAWVAERSDHVYTVTSDRNLVSRAVLERAGFVLVRRGVTHPRMTFNGGQGLLLRLDL